MEGPWPSLLLALLLLPASLALTLHHRVDTSDAYIITSDLEVPSSSVVAEPVQTPAIAQGQPPPTPPAGRTQVAGQERTSANNAPSETTFAAEDIRVLSLEHRSVDDNDTGAVEWNTLGNLTLEQVPESAHNVSFLDDGTAEVEPGSPDQDQLDFELSSLQNEDGQGPTALGNESLQQLPESGETMSYPVPEDETHQIAQNETVDISTAKPALDGPHSSVPHSNESSFELSEISPVTTLSAAEEDPLSPVTTYGDSSQVKVGGADAVTNSTTSTSLDDSTPEESIVKIATFSDDIQVSNISLGLNTTEAVAAQNVPVFLESERAFTPPLLNLEEATTLTLPEHNGSKVALSTVIPEATTTVKEFSTVLRSNVSNIEVQLIELAKTLPSDQNSTELVVQSDQLEGPPPTEANENHFERDATLHPPLATEAANQTLSEDLQQERLGTTQHLELPASSFTEGSLGIEDLNGAASSEILSSQASTPAASIIVHSASQQEPEAATATSLGVPTMLSTVDSALRNLTQGAHPSGLNISNSFLEKDKATEWEDGSIETNDTSLPELLDVSIEDSGNKSDVQLANTSSEAPHKTLEASQLEVPPATTSERPNSGEETTVRHTTEKRKETTAQTVANSSEAIPASQSAEVEIPNSTLAFANEDSRLRVHTVSMHTTIGPAVDHTELEEQQLPVTKSPAENFAGESEVPFPTETTTSYENTSADAPPTTVPAIDVDILETVPSQEFTAVKTDSPITTEDTTPNSHFETPTNSPTELSIPPLQRPETTNETFDEVTSAGPQSTTGKTSSWTPPATSTVGRSPPRPTTCVPLEPPKSPTHEFRLVFSTSSDFSWERVEALERRIQSFIRDASCPRRFARTAFALGPPHTLSWTDPSVNSTWCDRDPVDALFRTMRSDSGHPTPAITHAFYPEFRISSVELRFRGACTSRVSTFPVVATTVGVALSAALLAGLLTLLWKFLRMSPRSRKMNVTPAPPKDSFDLKQRRPILLPGESNKASANGTPHKSPHTKPNAPFVVDTDFCYINPNFLEVVKPSPPPPAPPYRQSLDRRVRSLEAVLPPPRPPHGPHSTLGNRSLGAEPTAEQDELNCTSSSSGVESDAQPSGETKSADSS